MGANVFKSTQVHAKRSRKYIYVFNLRLRLASPFGPGFRENNGNLMHTFFDCTILAVSIKSLFARATVRPWGILTVRIDITDETITTLIYIYKNRSKAYQNRFINREFQQTTTAGATTADVTEKVWGEYVSVVGQILAKRNTKMCETWAKEFRIYFI